MNPVPATLVPGLNRRAFVKGSVAALVTARLPAIAGGAASAAAAADWPIVDIHVHCTHRGRADEPLLLHQKNTGVKTSVLLPAGETGGLAAGVAGPAYAAEFARRHPGRFACFANENVFRPNAPREIERQLKQGAIGIGELKDNVACDSPEMQRLAEVAREYDVPMLIHFQDGAYNEGFARFHRMLEKFPTVRFIGHAQTFWARIDARYEATMKGRPPAVFTPGGLTDRWLSDYPNLFGDLAAGSGNGALARGEDFTPGFLRRHQDKLMYGSDCYCGTGTGPQCLAAAKLGFIQQYAPDDAVRKKILFGNARRILRLPAPAVV